MADRIILQLENLSLDGNIVESLEDLKTALFSIHPSVLPGIVSNVSFGVMFELLFTDDKEQISLCCAILKRLLTALGPCSVMERYSQELEKGLQHQSMDVQILCLNQLKMIGEENLEELIQHESMLNKMIQCLEHNSLQVANEASKALMTLGYKPDALNVLNRNPLLKALQEVMTKSSTIKFRVYDLAVSIGSLSVSALAHMSESGILHQLMNEVHKDDILLQLNAIELLSQLAMVEHGLSFLEEQGMVQRLETMMGRVESDPLASLLLPGLIKFFGGVARFHPKEVCSNNRMFIPTVFENLESNDPSLRGVAVQTVGFIASSPDGKMALEKLGKQMDKAVQTIGGLIQNSPSELRVNGLHCVKHLVRLEVADQTEELLSLTHHWFQGLGHKPFETILNIAQQPFPDLRTSSHEVLAALAPLPWGQKLMNEFPGFNEYLLDRLTETTKEGKESKFRIIKSLVDSPTALSIFGQPYYVNLKSYVLQGPFYVRVQSEIATEGQ